MGGGGGDSCNRTLNKQQIVYGGGRGQLQQNTEQQIVYGGGEGTAVTEH